MIYLASPYSHPDKDIREQNYIKVTKKAAELVSKGLVVVSPITYGHTLLDYKEMPTDWEFWNNFCLSILRHCDELWVYKMDGWNRSRGVAEEIEFAVKNNLHIKYIEYEDIL